MDTIIGEPLTNGATVIKSKHLHEDSYLVIAFRNKRPHPFVVWRADRLSDGTLDASVGNYAESMEQALEFFKERTNG